MDMWRGIPREEIPWFPTIDDSKCTGCGECLSICRNGVLGFDESSRTAQVTNPYNCVVECSTCARLCPTEAISFPDQAAFSEFIKQKLATGEKP
ncbi:MAG: 4Fe-4S dicluster domain-containing protein [Geobacter sp.]|nr:4Fe-4S dicluster domain-containing protein [Geobacter sp.]